MPSKSLGEKKRKEKGIVKREGGKEYRERERGREKEGMRYIGKDGREGRLGIE